MTTAATIAAKLTLDTKEYDDGLSDAEKKGKSFQKKLGKIGDSLIKTGGIMTASLTVPIVAGFKKMIDAASDMEQSAGAVNTVFGQSAYIIEDFGRRSATAVGLAESDFNQLAAVTGSFLQNLGYDANSAANETLVLTERASDMAAVFNTDVSQALQAIQSGLKGEFNPLEQFGVKINQAAINAKAMQMGLADATGAIDDNAKAQAALALVMEQTDRIAGQFASELDTFAVKMQVLKARFKDAGAELGERLLPYAIDLLEWASDMLDRFDELDPKTKDFIVGLAGVTAALGPLIVGMGAAVNTAGNLIKVWPKMIEFVTGSGAAFSTAAGIVGIYAAAIAGLLILADKMSKKYREARDEILDENKAVINLDGSYQDYLDSMDEYLKLAGLRVNKDGEVVNKMGAVTNAVDILTQKEFDLQQQTGSLTGDMGVYQMQMSYVTGAAYDVADATGAMADASADASDALETIDFGTILGLAKQYDDIMGDMADKQERINELSTISTTGGYLDGIYYSAKDAQTEIGNLQGEIGGLQQSMTDLANQVVLDMFQATIAIDGITQTEADAYFQMAADMGIISEEAANKAIETYGNAINEINGMQLNDKSATYTVYHRTVYTSDAADNYHWQAMGGFETASQPTVVGYGEAGKETAVFIPQGKTIYDVATPNQIASIMPGFREGQTNNQNVTNNYNFEAILQPDEVVQTIEQLKVLA